jgi:SAM-dependent methyltransferase
MAKPVKTEGFSQELPFVLKQQTNIYDDFYVSIYDEIMQPMKRADFECAKIIDATMPSKKHSTFLDVGSGTGALTNAIQMAGYTVEGIDISPTMKQYAETTYPDLSITCGDVTDPMAYDRSTFSHVLCTGFTIYQFPNKLDFFQNCFYWLKPSGYLILHLVDPHKFDTIVPAGKPASLKSPQLYANKRITDTEIDFQEFSYHSTYDLANYSKDSTVIMKETFTDRATNNIRQNEMVYYMEEPDAILTKARSCGFIVHAQANYSEYNGDANQYLFILERPH